MIEFDLPKDKSSIIKVIGVGGGGSNAVSHMYRQGIEGVDFIICNTDSQALHSSSVPNRIQLGPNLTQGLGAGANPDIGRLATEESMEEIRRILEVNTKMVFITAGMGGGTGTGGAPIVARMCRELGLLTVGIVTTPFSYEGRKRISHAHRGVESLKEYVDTLLVISNDKLRHQFGNLTMSAAFSTADNVLATAAKCITDIITSTGQVNVDFADVCTVMRGGGVAILGSARARGENRAQVAVEQALNSPLLDDNDIRGAQWILLNINSAQGEWEFTFDEVEIIQQYLHAHAGPDRDVILGLGYDNSLGDQIGITLIATGFKGRDQKSADGQEQDAAPKDEKVVLQLRQETSEAAPTRKEVQAASAAPIAPAAVTRTPEPAPARPHPEKPVVRVEQASIPFQQEPSELLPPELMPTLARAEQRPASGSPEKTSPQPPPTGQPEERRGSFLSKPTRIYDEEPPAAEPIQHPDPINHQPEAAPEEESDSGLRLVIRETPAADEPTVPSTHIRLGPVEEPALQDEAEEHRRKMAERLNKLRNLSFNRNATDPNNEYEHVPAYVRRNSIDRPQAVPERYYSNYTVRSDENNQAHLSTLNTFLDGKKPD